MKIGVIGCGVMGGAIAAQAAKHHQVLLYDHKLANSKDLGQKIQARVCEGLDEICKNVDAIILSVKPKDLYTVAEGIQDYLHAKHAILSILSGVTLDKLKEVFTPARAFRLMPNLPLLCGKGMIGVVQEEISPQDDYQVVEEAMKGLGTLSYLPEKLIDAFTALTGSNPAFIYAIIEAMVAAGVELGFKNDQALQYVIETFEGSLALLKTEKTSPEELRKKITSPGGTTIAGLNEMEKRGVRFGLIETLKRTAKRAQEMGEESAKSPELP